MPTSSLHFTQIQLFHFADELQDQAACARLEKYNVRLMQIDEKHGGERRQYSIKPKAFIKTTFDEFAYFDADSIPLQPLENFFDSAEYRTYGSAFYPDLSKDNPKTLSGASWVKPAPMNGGRQKADSFSLTSRPMGALIWRSSSFLCIFWIIRNFTPHWVGEIRTLTDIASSLSDCPTLKLLEHFRYWGLSAIPLASQQIISTATRCCNGD